MSNIHLSNVKSHLAQSEFDAVLISSLSNIIYLTNFSHFTEIEREAFVLITRSNNYIFTDARYSHAVKNNLKDFKLLETSISKSFIDHLGEIIEKEKINVLGLEENNLTASEHKKILSTAKQAKHFDLRKFRSVKQKEEIEKIKKACEIGDKAFEFVLKKIILGMTEKEVAFELETFIRKNGCEPSFPTIIAFEENAAIPHHKTGNRKLEINELILMDFGVKYENYCSDMTRTIFAGIANDEKKKTYQVVLDAQRKAIEQLSNETMKQSKPISAKDIDNTARKYIISKGFASFPHFLGHGIGLQVHEAPSLSKNSNDVLTEGMVFSIEPGIYFPDKFGVRIEDLFTIENNKLVQLTNSSRDLIEIKI